MRHRAVDTHSAQEHNRGGAGYTLGALILDAIHWLEDSTAGWFWIGVGLVCLAVVGNLVNWAFYDGGRFEWIRKTRPWQIIGTALAIALAIAFLVAALTGPPAEVECYHILAC